MERVMERRNLVAGLVVLALSLFMLSGTAIARTLHRSKQHSTTVSKTVPTGEECLVKSEPGAFMDTGESLKGGPMHASSIADIIEVECNQEYAGSTVTVADQELYARCSKTVEGVKEHFLSWTVPPMSPEEFGDTGPEAKTTLDNDGNAQFVVWGTNCAAGGTLVTADLEAGKHPTAMTEFTVTPPKVTEEGVFVFPSVTEPPSEATGGANVENDENSSLAAIIYVEYSPEFSEEYVNINDRQLYAKCKYGSKIKWYGPNEELLTEESPEAGIETVQLDDDGNAFVVAIAGESCQAGKTLVEVSLESAPYTTFDTNFSVLPPEPSI